ncbi:MAG: lysozyme inhibitor LprI family protein [Amaricoccus sp.]|uniref:lysozyme inhibitor LprI family protein n=1 Tax=Amaricoccus sp. TaxID=1872485 RepID=UPI0039E4DA1B
MTRAFALALPALAVLALAGPVAAEDCTTLATQLEMNQCAGRNFDAADTALNQTWRAVTARLAGDAAGLGKLKAAERAWVAFRDAECTFQSMGVEGGSIYPMIWTECRETLTRERAATLQGYLACEEGDLPCPLPPQ